MLLNLSGKLTENFETSDANNEAAKFLFQNAAGENQNRALARNESNNGEVNHMTTHVKSIESIYSGARYDVVALPLNTRLVPTININIKTDAFNSFSVKDRILSRESTDYKDFKQTFKLVRIESMADVLKFIKEGTYIEAEEKEFPYYFIKAPGINNLSVLNIGDSEISITRASNRPNQRFNIEFEPKQALVDSQKDTLDINIKLDQDSIDTLISKLGLQPEENLNSNTKLNNAPFNTNDLEDEINDSDLISEMMNDVDNSYNYNSLPDSKKELLKCNHSKWIPREAIRSACRGCDPDLIN
jgi:hypothetical protein